MDALLSSLNDRFVSTDRFSRRLLDRLDPADLYRRPRVLARELQPFSVGEYIVRSAAMVEKTFGGITTRLWDDPFEWTLREKLATRDMVREYLDEVSDVRKGGFEFIASDEQLLREIPSPTELRPMFDVLLECMARSEHYQGRAFAMFQMLSDTSLPRI